MGSSAIQEHIVRTSVLEACSRRGIAHDSPLRYQLESEAELVGGGRDAYVRTSSGLSLDERISELATVPEFSSSMPAAKPVVASTDMKSMAENFADIASGKVVVR